jgi:endonuclease/exonuclease/phosphatase family metal-dependent hydrolase
MVRHVKGIVGAAIPILAVAVACVGNAPLTRGGADETCTARMGPDVRWLRVAPLRERAAIDRWCGGVGPPARIAAAPPPAHPSGSLAIVGWNTHVGAGDVDTLVADLRSGRLTDGTPAAAIVLLLQEVYRAGTDVPAGVSNRVRWASMQRPAGPGGKREDVVDTARRLGMEAVYVPSMRNGGPSNTPEDRGNAILSTLPLSEVTAIELPLERQRRVAVEATITVAAPGRDPLPLRLVSTHFTNMVMHHLWVLSEAGRVRQARALARALPKTGALVIGGDFNAWFAFRDAAYREMRTLADPAPSQDRRATFGPLRLDHVLFRLPADWHASVRRAEDRYGSDHYPLIATIEAR